MAVVLTLLFLLQITTAEHHMKRAITARQSGPGVPLITTNKCASKVWPGIVSQHGDGPSNTGFQLSSGETKKQTVSSNWQGRIWGRTNCSFNEEGFAPNGGPACTTGDCGGRIKCIATGETPVTLAEFTLDGGQSQSFYDISLVDGYNLPMAIVLVGESTLPPEKGNPSCNASPGELAPSNFNPYGGGQEFLGTTSSNPLPFDREVTEKQVSKWCPWDLQKTPPTKPGDGVYPYPDTEVKRPLYDPCLSACAKYGKEEYCCTGQYHSPTGCPKNYYSKAAKAVCPDAYSYAFDDPTSTFITQKGPGFEVIFCPGGRSTTILTPSESSGGSLRKANPTLDVLWVWVVALALAAL